MAKLLKKKDESNKKTRIDRNISKDKDYYSKPVIIKEDIQDKNKYLNKIYDSKLLNMILIIVAAVLTGFLLFYFINYDNFNTTKKNREVVDKNYVFLGDSITSRYDLDKYFPDYKYRVVNSGIGGDKTSDILDDMYKRVYRYNPSDVFILIGTNDITGDYSLQKIYDNYISIITGIRKNRPAAKIKVISTYPVNEEMYPKLKKYKRNDAVKILNKSLKIYCDNNNIVYINMYKKLIDNKGFLKKEYTEEGLHINENGYEVITKELRKYMEE